MRSGASLRAVHKLRGKLLLVRDLLLLELEMEMHVDRLQRGISLSEQMDVVGRDVGRQRDAADMRR
jgi:hypothetical protein